MENNSKIEMVETKKIIPYKNNPRFNDGAVEAVANSIKEFGVKQPLVLDKDYVVIAGHTRLKAAKKLKLKEVPCIIARDLTAEQAQAYRVADNKTGELAEWDFEMLSAELEEIANFNFDMDEFSFDFENTNQIDLELDQQEDQQNSLNNTPEDDDDEDIPYYGAERERTFEAYNLYDYDQTRTVGKYQMPFIEAVDHVPNNLIGFNYAKSSSDYESGIHFYLDDYQFERIWNDPYKYVDLLSKFDCVLTPDFSLYMDMPMAMKIWNVYRSRLVGQILQDSGITVIPTLSWAEKETFEFCFDGIEKGGTVSISTIGVKRDEEAFDIWKAGVDEAIKRLEPKCIVVYGGKVDYDFGNVKVIYFDINAFAKETER